MDCAERDVRPGDRVAVVLGNSAEFFATIIAVSQIGALVVAVNYLLSVSEIRYVLDHAEPTMIIFDQEIVGRDLAAVLRDAGAFDAQRSMPAILLHGDSSAGDGWLPFAHINQRRAVRAAHHRCDRSVHHHVHDRLDRATEGRLATF